MFTILVVDDDKTFLRLLQTMLKMEGYDTVMRSAPEEVVTTVREEDPALVLMDIHIRDRDTLGALRELKHDEQLRDIPVIMTSGMDRRQECLDAGANAFILKPFRPSEMLDTIAEMIRATGHHAAEAAQDVSSCDKG